MLYLPFIPDSNIAISLCYIYLLFQIAILLKACKFFVKWKNIIPLNNNLFLGNSSNRGVINLTNHLTLAFYLNIYNLLDVCFASICV